MNTSRTLILILMPFFLVGCSNQNRNSLTIKSGRTPLDETEIAKILQAYSNPTDSLKKKAALFLLANLQFHYSMENAITEKIKEELDKSEVSFDNYGAAFPLFAAILNPVFNEGELDDRLVLTKYYDKVHVTAAFIMNEIELAFEVWENSRWKDKVHFNTFCEYILPYRVMHEPLDFNRKFFHNKYAAYVSRLEKKQDLTAIFDSIISTNPVNYHKAMDIRYPYLMGVNQSCKLTIGNCIQKAVSNTMILRANGIPATIDYVPQWGNYPGRHYTTVLMTQEASSKRRSAFEMSLSSFQSVISEDSLPEGFSKVQYLKTIPKVYRMAWSVQPERLTINKEEKTGLFANLYEKDVTDEYTDCSEVSIEIKNSRDSIVYLCVFDSKEWLPVCVSKIENGQALFSKIGRMVVYLPAVYKESETNQWNMQPVGKPFYVNAEGMRITLGTNSRFSQNIKLYSKYPLFAYTAAHAYRMKGGKFQGANSSDFKEAETLLTIDYYPFYRQQVDIVTRKTYRYVRYLPPQDITYSFSELHYYTKDKKGDNIRLEGTYFDKYGTPSTFFANLGDNNLDTYTAAPPVKESWLGYDLGENNTNQLTRIIFAPQNDGNCIIAGYLYELYCWKEGKWNSLGIRQAEHNFLEYQKVPSETLFLLKCHTKGEEARIFTIENNKQRWW